MSFAGRVLLTTVAILIVTVGGLTIAADRWLRRSLEASLQAELEREIRLVTYATPREAADLNAVADRLGRLTGYRVTFIDTTGRVLGDSDFDDASLRLLENHLRRPEVQQALRSGTGQARRVSASTHREEIKVAVRGGPGIVRLSAPVERIDAIVSGAQRAVFLAALGALLLGIVLAVVAGRATARPLRRLATAARNLAAGHTPEYPVSRAPEVRHLVHAFRTMQEEVTARIAELQYRREEMRTLIESMVEGVVATDQDGAVVICNRASRRLFEYGPDEPLPNVQELFHTPDARDVVRRVLDGEAVLGREVIVRDRTVLATARPLPTGGAVICLHDVTDLRRLEAVRRDFVANVSHELRTPLTSIAGYAETVLGEEPDAETRKRFLTVILTNARRMHDLVEDLLDLARVESGAWVPATEEVSLAPVVEAAWSPFAERATAGDLSFTADVPSDLVIRADPDAVRQILTNLYDNAVRHTPPGGRIAVSARIKDHQVEITVADTGVGIPAEHLPRVFERFYRVDPGRSRRQGGTGLGLSIVRHLVQAHGGTVSLESAVGRGTTVRIVLPRRPPRAS